eukprot:COSAG01_NODE_3675_length_5804_cov_4.926919_2_plen_51_part_00
MVPSVMLRRGVPAMRTHPALVISLTRRNCGNTAYSRAQLVQIHDALARQL